MLAIASDHKGGVSCVIAPENSNENTEVSNDFNNQSRTSFGVDCDSRL